MPSDLAFHGPHGPVARDLSTSGTTEVHAHRALLFPFLAILCGALTSHFSSRIPHQHAKGSALTKMVLRPLLRLPFTALLGLQGVALGAIYNMGSSVQDSSFGHSIKLWLNIDPHLVLFGFLPALLFGDAMNMNVLTFRRTLKQCLVLAVPGVLLCTGLTGLAAHAVLPYGWSYYLAFTFGAITSATDPVAVVTMLHELGASPRLTMIIAGESLLNDGTAMVAFLIFFERYKSDTGTSTGANTGGTSVVQDILWMPLGAVLIGFICGLLCIAFLQHASEKAIASDGGVQTALTLATAYLTYYLAEDQCHASGVLATVTAAVTLAFFAPPLYVNFEALEHVWKIIEFVGNSILFILSGLIICNDTLDNLTTSVIGWNDFGLVLVMYVIVMLIRIAMNMLFFPLLNKVARPGYEPQPKDVLVMTWGGLRGAVALALAIAVRNHTKGSAQHSANGQLLLWHVGMLVLLTLFVNGTTCAALLRALGMTKRAKAREALLQDMRATVQRAGLHRYEELCAEESTEHTLLPHDRDQVKELVPCLGTINGNFDHAIGGLRMTLRGAAALHRVTDVKEQRASGAASTKPDSSNSRRLSTGGLIARNRRVKHGSKFTLSGSGRGMLHSKAAQEDVCRRDMLYAVREVFLHVVRAKYQEQIEHGAIPEDSEAALMLLRSVDIASEPDHLARGITDWDDLQDDYQMGKLTLIFKRIPIALSLAVNWLHSWFVWALQKLIDLVLCWFSTCKRSPQHIGATVTPNDDIAAAVPAAAAATATEAHTPQDTDGAKSPPRLQRQATKATIASNVWHEDLSSAPTTAGQAMTVEYFVANEQKLYIAQAYCTAHQEAREEISVYFMHEGEGGPHAMVKEARVVCEESKRLCTKAQKVLETIDEAVVHAVRAKLVAHDVLTTQREKVLSMQEGGLLNSTEAMEMLSPIIEAIAHVDSERMVQKLRFIRKRGVNCDGLEASEQDMLAVAATPGEAAPSSATAKRGGGRLRLPKMLSLGQGQNGSVRLENVAVVGQELDVRDTSDTWSAARVVEADQERVKVTFVGWPDKWDEWLVRSDARIAPRGTHTYCGEQHGEPRVGQRLQCRDARGQWLAAQVVEARADAVKVHYYNWHPKFDEWIDRSAWRSRLAPFGTH